MNGISAENHKPFISDMLCLQLYTCLQFFQEKYAGSKPALFHAI